MQKFSAFMCLYASNTISYIVMFAKYLIYKSKAKAILPSLNVFKIKLENRLKLERVIALKHNRLEEFTQAWEGFL